MCLPQFEYQHYDQSTSRGLQKCIHWRRIILMAAIIGTILVVLATVIAVVTLNTNGRNECAEGLQCMQFNECDDNSNGDFSFPCGERNSKLCCKPKLLNSRGSLRPENKQKLMKMNCGMTSNLPDKIAFGDKALLGEFPWMAILIYNYEAFPSSSTYECAGTLIHDKYILTAAHCTNIKNLILSKAALGLTNITAINSGKECEKYDDVEECSDVVVVSIEKIIVHPEYNKTSYKNDIALLQLKHPVQFNYTIQPVCLPFDMELETFWNETKFMISGWGTTENHTTNGISDNLNYVRQFHPWHYDKCNDYVKHPQVMPITQTQVCASGKNLTDICSGDSGGPMTYDLEFHKELRTVQFGIVSFKTFDTCGTQQIPLILTRVDKYLNWIVDNMEL